MGDAWRMRTWKEFVLSKTNCVFVFWLIVNGFSITSGRKYSGRKYSREYYRYYRFLTCCFLASRSFEKHCRPLPIEGDPASRRENSSEECFSKIFPSAYSIKMLEKDSLRISLLLREADLWAALNGRHESCTVSKVTGNIRADFVSFSRVHLRAVVSPSYGIRCSRVRSSVSVTVAIFN